MFLTKNLIITKFGLLTLLMCACSCTNTEKTATGTTVSDSSSLGNTPEIEQAFCFRKVSGLQNKDTLFIKLNIDKHKVIGEMSNSIYEKDARKGKLDGELNDNNIKALWTYVQEGTTDTLQIEFRLKDQELLQRPLVYNRKSGRQQTDKNSIDWIIVPKVDCGTTKKSFKN